MDEVINFMTGTGRCGSTILSRLLMHHPDALVMREFLSSMDHRTLHHGDVSGEGLAVLLSGDLGVAYSLYLPRGYTIPEVIYKLRDDEKHAGWSKPGIQLAALEYVSEDPQGLYDALMAWARKQPTAPLRTHYPRMFDFLKQKLGRDVFIEGSAAGNIDLKIFPNSRFLHIHRSGPETVLSMYNHAHFRLVGSILLDPPSDEELREAVTRIGSVDADPIHKRLRKEDHRILSVLAGIWTTVTAMLYREMTKVKPENYMEVRFEDLTSDPKAQLKRIAEFFELPERGEAWMDEAGKILNPVKERFPEMPQEIQTMLKQACFAGEVLNGREPRQVPQPFAERLFKAHGRTMAPLV